MTQGRCAEPFLDAQVSGSISRRTRKNGDDSIMWPKRFFWIVVSLALLLLLAWFSQFGNPSRSTTAVAPNSSANTLTEFQLKQQEYTTARQNYEQQATAYWTLVADKKRSRSIKRSTNQVVQPDDYVLAQPPVYFGPPRPVDPSAVPSAPPARQPVPVVSDFVSAAVERFAFAPERPNSELEFKRAYAQSAAEAGLSKEQIVKIYAFESGGNGAYDVQAGLEYAKPGAKAISTALGYNQLLLTNTIDLMKESGGRLVDALKQKADRLSGPPKEKMEPKIAATVAMVEFAQSIANPWDRQQELNASIEARAAHAMNLDVDVGPWLQTRKLLDSLEYARKRGYARPLSAAQLEIMNLAGDGSGMDMVMLSPEMGELIPTSNFFQRAGYELNPIVQRNNVVTALLKAIDAKMDQESLLPGAKELANAFPKL